LYPVRLPVQFSGCEELVERERAFQNGLYLSDLVSNVMYRLRISVSGVTLSATRFHRRATLLLLTLSSDVM
jgi:hypothetical protein